MASTPKPLLWAFWRFSAARRHFEPEIWHRRLQKLFLGDWTLARHRASAITVDGRRRLLKPTAAQRLIKSDTIEQRLHANLKERLLYGIQVYFGALNLQEAVYPRFITQVCKAKRLGRCRFQSSHGCELVPVRCLACQGICYFAECSLYGFF